MTQATFTPARSQVSIRLWTSRAVVGRNDFDDELRRDGDVTIRNAGFGETTAGDKRQIWRPNDRRGAPQDDPGLGREDDTKVARFYVLTEQVARAKRDLPVYPPGGGISTTSPSTSS